MVNETGLKFNYTAKEKALKTLELEKQEKKSVEDYNQILTELNIMRFE